MYLLVYFFFVETKKQNVRIFQNMSLLFLDLANGQFSKMMAVQDAKIKNIAKDLITGIGGLRIKDVIGNFRKGPAVKVGYLHLEKKVKNFFFFFFIQANYFIWTQTKVELVVIANPNGMSITGTKLKNVLSKSLQVHVRPDNILRTTPHPEARNAIVLKITFLTLLKGPASSNLPLDRVPTVTWLLKMKMAV